MAGKDDLKDEIRNRGLHVGGIASKKKSELVAILVLNDKDAVAGEGTGEAEADFELALSAYGDLVSGLDSPSTMPEDVDDPTVHEVLDHDDDEDLPESMLAELAEEPGSEEGE